MLRGILFQCLVADLNGILNAIAKSEMTGEIENDGSKIQNSRGKILFAQVFYPPELLYPAG